MGDIKSIKIIQGKPRCHLELVQKVWGLGMGPKVCEAISKNNAS